MARYEYKVIPAPSRGSKAPGLKGAEARFANGLEEAMNEWAAQGWEYLRADILPSEERQGLASTRTFYRSVLVFRRLMAETPQTGRPAPPLTAETPDATPAPETAGPPGSAGAGETAPPPLGPAPDDTYVDTAAKTEDPPEDASDDGRMTEEDADPAERRQ